MHDPLTQLRSPWNSSCATACEGVRPRNAPVFHSGERIPFVGTMLEGKSIRKSALACGVSATTSLRWHHRFLNCTADQRATIFGAIINAYADASVLTGVAGEAGAANPAWGRDLLPVLLSWIL